MSIFTQHLSQQFKTFAPDLRGYGKSQAKTAFKMRDHLVDLEALLDHHQIKRCLVLGWSLGGILATELALRQPERISGLILIASAMRPRSSHPPISWEDNLYTGLASVINWLQPGWQWNIDTFGKRSLYRYLIQQHTAIAYQHLATEGMPAYFQTSVSARQALSNALKQEYDRLAELSRIQCPSLVMAGTADRHITLESSLETAQHLPKCNWISYPDVAHLFPWEIPNRVLQDIDNWIESNPEATGN
jgi:pimeloyl-ACP methyl ester carboxylesterase